MAVFNLYFYLFFFNFCLKKIPVFFVSLFYSEFTLSYYFILFVLTGIVIALTNEIKVATRSGELSKFKSFWIKAVIATLVSMMIYIISPYLILILLWPILNLDGIVSYFSHLWDDICYAITPLPIRCEGHYFRLFKLEDSNRAPSKYAYQLQSGRINQTEMEQLTHSHGELAIVRLLNGYVLVDTKNEHVPFDLFNV